MNKLNSFAVLFVAFLLSVPLKGHAMTETPNHHVTKISIEKPYAEVWAWVSQPMNFPKLYPNWVKDITELSENNYEVTMPEGYKHTMESKINKETGSIDFDVNPGEVSRSRLIPLSENETLYIHIAVKGDQPDELFKIIMENVDKDYINAKAVIETSKSPPQY